MRKLWGAMSSAAAIAVATANPAWAQEAPADEIAYPASFFAEYSPQTALDIVLRTPGFTLDEGDDVRGFGAAAGNVLIDGARPSVKGDGLEAFLARIPADRVLEVRLIRNAQTAEAQGQALILNIIRRPVETSGAWTAGLEQTGSGPVVPFGSLSFAGAALGFEGSFEVEFVVDETPIRTRRAFSAADGALLANWAERRVERFEQLTLSGDARRPVFGGVLALTASGRVQRFALDRESRIYAFRPAGGAPDGFAPFAQEEDEYGLDFGADYSLSFGDVDAKLVGLVSFESETEEQRDSRRSAAFALVQAQTLASEREALEAVLRSSAAWGLGSAWRFEAAAEVAYNQLDSRLAVTQDLGAGPVPVALPGAATVVEETRGEALLTFAYAPPGRLRFDGALGGETSEIAVSGDAQNSQSFTFFKPRASLSYDLGGGATARLGAERRIGQLDFGDFAASAGLFDGVSAAGNPALGPETAWVYSLDLDWRRDDGFAVTVEAFHEEREGVLEQVALPSGGFGVANAGAATVTGFTVSLDLPLDAVIPGGEFSLYGESSDSVFRDPLTDRDRLLTDFGQSFVEASFRHDPPNLPLSWGLTWRGPSGRTGYRIDEQDLRTDSAQIGGFMETNALFGLRTRLELRNLGTARFQRERRRFTPDRSGTLSGIERRFATYGAVVSLEISDQF